MMRHSAKTLAYSLSRSTIFGAGKGEQAMVLSEITRATDVPRLLVTPARSIGDYGPERLSNWDGDQFWIEHAYRIRIKLIGPALWRILFRGLLTMNKTL